VPCDYTGDERKPLRWWQCAEWKPVESQLMADRRDNVFRKAYTENTLWIRCVTSSTCHPYWIMNNSLAFKLIEYPTQQSVLLPWHHQLRPCTCNWRRRTTRSDVAYYNLQALLFVEKWWNGSYLNTAPNANIHVSCYQPQAWQRDQKVLWEVPRTLVNKLKLSLSKPWRWVQVLLHSFWTWTQGGGKWWSSRPSRSVPDKRTPVSIQ
jgi:hypothetical protein